MDKVYIDTKIQIGIFRDLYKRNLLTKIQLDKAIEIVVKKEAIHSANNSQSEFLHQPLKNAEVGGMG